MQKMDYFGTTKKGSDNRGFLWNLANTPNERSTRLRIGMVEITSRLKEAAENLCPINCCQDAIKVRNLLRVSRP